MRSAKTPAGPANAPAPFDPAAAGWTPYSDEGFIGLVGPFWQRSHGDGFHYAFLAEPKHHNLRGVVRGDIPLPAGRPYSLGNTAEDATAAGATEISASRSMRTERRRFEPSRTASVDEATLDAQAMMMPTAAYAPVARDRGASLMSGRGLY